MFELKLGSFKLSIGEPKMSETKKPCYKLKLEDLDRIYKGVIEGLLASEGPHPAPAGHNQSAGGAAMSVAGCGGDPLYSSGEYNLLKLFLTNDETRLAEIEALLKREYPTRPTAWDTVVKWADSKLNPPDKVEVRPKRPEDFLNKWPCGCYSTHPIGTAAAMSEGIRKGGVVCSGWNPSKKRWGGCGKRFVWLATENKWVEDNKLVRVTGNPSNIISELKQR